MQVSRVSIGVMTCLLSIPSLSMGSAANELRSRSERYEVVVRVEKDADSYTGRVLSVETLHRKTGVKQFVKRPTSSAGLTDLLFIGEDRLIVRGKFPSEGGDVVTVVDLRENKVIDVISGYDAAFSPNKRFVAYRFHVPPYPVPRWISTMVILTYDLQGSPQENSMNNSSRVIQEWQNEADGWNPENRGYIIYPNENREKRIYFIPASSEWDQRRLVSPIIWNVRSDKIAFVEAFQNESLLLVINVSKGPAMPTIDRYQLKKQQFYGEQIPWRPEYSSATVVARELRFADDDKAVVITSWPLGPFAEKQVSIRIN